MNEVEGSIVRRSSLAAGSLLGDVSAGLESSVFGDSFRLFLGDGAVGSLSSRFTSVVSLVRSIISFLISIFGDRFAVFAAGLVKKPAIDP